jgi:hypothetical protein
MPKAKKTKRLKKTKKLSATKPLRAFDQPQPTPHKT